MKFPDKEKNIEHLNNPKPGDYWSEMLCGVCVVLSVSKHDVIICRTKKEIDRDSWTWDLAKREIMTHEEFKKWLCYDSIPETTWCDVMPEGHKWAVNCAA